MQLHTFDEFSVLNEASNKLKIRIPKDVKDLHKLFKKNRKKLYVVGGAVRDTLLNKIPKDFDLVTNATPKEILKITKDYKHTEVGQQFGIVVVITPDMPEGIEIATFREDIGKGRRPDAVKLSTIEGDVKRRDLTINALFFDMDRQEIVDLVGGLKDIEGNNIRTVGDAVARFEEDALRKLRAIRFAGRTGGSLDKEIQKALTDDNSLSGVSGERIRDEFSKMIKTSKSSVHVLELLNNFKFFEAIFPGLIVNKDFIETKSWIVQLAHLLVTNNSDIELRKLLNKAKYSTNEIDAIVYIKHLMYLTPENVTTIFKEKKRNLVSDKEILEFFKKNSLHTKTVEVFLKKYKMTTTGDDVEKLGIKKGPEMGVKIREIEAEKFKALLK